MAENTFNAPKVVIPVEIDPDSLTAMRQAVEGVVREAVKAALADVGSVGAGKDDEDREPRSPSKSLPRAGSEPARENAVYLPSAEKSAVETVRTILEKMQDTQSDAYLLLEQIADAVTFRRD